MCSSRPSTGPSLRSASIDLSPPGGEETLTSSGPTSRPGADGPPRPVNARVGMATTEGARHGFLRPQPGLDRRPHRRRPGRWRHRRVAIGASGRCLPGSIRAARLAPTEALRSVSVWATGRGRAVEPHPSTLGLHLSCPPFRARPLEPLRSCGRRRADALPLLDGRRVVRGETSLSVGSGRRPQPAPAQDSRRDQVGRSGRLHT
jgi:hypothetical protein